MTQVLKLLSLFALLALVGCAHAPAEDPHDPLEPINRVVFRFNDTADHYVLRPLATGYVYVTPQIVRTGVSNFFSNLESPVTIVNDVLQLKLRQSASDTGRLVLNTIAGVGGVVDVASSAGLPRHDEDFGQTLGHWGVGEGWYLMLPLFGPSDNRDLVGRIADTPLHPDYWLPARYDAEKYGATALHIINERASLLDEDKVLNQQLDKYLFVRTAYLRTRQAAIYDGHPPPEKDEYKIFDDDSSTPKPDSTSEDRH